MAERDTTEAAGCGQIPTKARTGGRPMTVPDFMAAKQKGRKLSVLTAYDYTMARLLDEVGVDSILVGDSLGMVIQGQPNSLSVTLEDVIYHTRIVARGVQRSLLIADMPFMSYQVSPEQALINAGQLVKEASAQAVKVEGGKQTCPAIAAIARADIPVMGHIGLTPQSVHRLGGFRVQRQEQQLVDAARAVEDAGAFSLVIECVPSDIGRKITESVGIPTIGIGAGAGCDGQVLVTHDMLGMFADLQPKFVKRFAQLGQQLQEAVKDYVDEVTSGSFPGAEHEFK